MADIRDDLNYTNEHEWVHVEDGIATVGISDFAQSELGDIVFVDLPAEGEKVNANEPVGTIEAVKTVADIFAPLSGNISEVNDRLTDDPDLINRDPYGEGWMMKIKLGDESEVAALLSATEYEGFVEDAAQQAADEEDVDDEEVEE